MKKIDTTGITSGSWLPVVGNYGGNNFANGGTPGSFAGLDFLQQAYTECINALSQFIVNDQTKPTIMYIAPPPPPGPWPYVEAYTGTSGFMNYQGEIFYFGFSNLVATRLGGGPVYQNASIVTGFSGADPVTFSDSSKHNVHQVRQVQFSWSGTRNAGNLPDYDLWLNATNNSYAAVLAQTLLNNFITGTYNPFVTAYNTNLNPTIIQVGSGGGAPAFGSGWSNSMGIPQHTGNTPNPLSFYIMWNRVYIWGEVSNSSVGNNSTIFTLPSGYCPMAAEEVFEVWNTGLQNVAGGHNVTPPYYLVITSSGAVQLLSNISSPGPARNITLSGISFTQGVHSTLTTFYTTVIADVATRTDSYSSSETAYSYSDFSDS